MFKATSSRILIPALFVISAVLSLQAKPTEIKLKLSLTISREKIVKVAKTIGDETKVGTPAGGGESRTLAKSGKAPDSYGSPISRNSTIKLTIQEIRDVQPPSGYDIKDHIEIEFLNTEMAANKPAILTEPFFPPSFRAAGDKEPVLEFDSDLRLELPGRKYSLKVNWYESLEDKLKGKNPSTVYEGNFVTRGVYYVGLNAGWLLPIGKRFDSYALYHTDPADASDGSLQTIRRTRSYQTKGILFASIFPAGVEPEAPLSWRNIHLNLGTELSSSIMKSLYLGTGYDFRFFSVNLFYGITKASVLPDEYAGFVDRTIANKKISSLPLIEKWDTFFGAAVSFPFSLATIFGKMIGL